MEIVIRAERLWNYKVHIFGAERRRYSNNGSERRRERETVATQLNNSGREIQGLRFSTNSNRKAERGLNIESVKLNGAEKFN